MQIGELVNGASVGDIINIEITTGEWREYEVISLNRITHTYNGDIIPEINIRTREVKS